MAVPSQVVPTGSATDDGADSSATDEGDAGAEGEVVVEEAVSPEGESADEGKESSDS